MKIDIKELANILGKELAHSDDEIQSNFLNQFSYELQVCCKDKFETQLCYLSDKLSLRSREVILSLAEYINLRTAKNVE